MGVLKREGGRRMKWGRVEKERKRSYIRDVAICIGEVEEEEENGRRMRNGEEK